MNDEARAVARFSVLTVKETPHVRSGSVVTIESEQGVLAQMVLYAGSAGQVEKMGVTAAAQVQQKLVEKMLEINLIADPDVGRGDWQ